MITVIYNINNNRDTDIRQRKNLVIIVVNVAINIFLIKHCYTAELNNRLTLIVLHFSAVFLLTSKTLPTMKSASRKEVRGKVLLKFI